MDLWIQPCAPCADLYGKSADEPPHDALTLNGAGAVKDARVEEHDTRSVSDRESDAGMAVLRDERKVTTIRKWHVRPLTNLLFVFLTLGQTRRPIRRGRRYRCRNKQRVL